MEQKTILAVITDLYFSVQVGDVGRKLGYKVEYAKTTEELSRKMAESKPCLVVLDLAETGVQWDNIVRSAKENGEGPPVLAFVHHMDLESREKALKAGVDAVVSKAVFSTDLHKLVEKYLS